MIPLTKQISLEQVSLLKKIRTALIDFSAVNTHILMNPKLSLELERLGLDAIGDSIARKISMLRDAKLSEVYLHFLNEEHLEQFESMKDEKIKSDVKNIGDTHLKLVLGTMIRIRKINKELLSLLILSKEFDCKVQKSPLLLKEIQKNLYEQKTKAIIQLVADLVTLTEQEMQAIPRDSD